MPITSTTLSPSLSLTARRPPSLTAIMSRKRKEPVTDDPKFDWEGLLLELQEQGGTDLVMEVVWNIVNEAGLTFKDIERHQKLVSFSDATWDKVAPMFGLDPALGFDQLPTFSFPIAVLPPSFHREVMRASAKWLDVYQERGASCKRSSARTANGRGT